MATDAVEVMALLHEHKKHVLGLLSPYFTKTAKPDVIKPHLDAAPLFMVSFDFSSPFYALFTGFLARSSRSR
jgi:hypothetical protein